MKLHRKKMIIIAAAAAMAAHPLTAMAAGNSLADQLNGTSSFYSSLRGISSSVSANANASSDSLSSNPSTGPGALNSSSSGSGTTGRNGVIIENNTSSSQNNSSSATAGTLPSKKIVSLSEQYYDEYGMYEEGIDGQFYFYTNIGNGQITDQSVYIDFPSNLTYTAELDGETITYISKQPMVQKGT